MQKQKILAIYLFVLLFILVQTVSADVTYIVQPGDNLSKIAARFGISVQDIVEVNSIEDSNVIQAGKELTIPTGAGTAVESPEEAPPDDAPPSETETPAEETPVDIAPEVAEPGKYVVQVGDSLSKIAQTYGTDYLTLADLNGIESPYRIQIGQILDVPGATGAAGESEVEQAASDTPQTPAAQIVGESSVSAPRISASAPRVFETTITIPTYDYLSGFVLTTEGDSVYPYPRLDFSKVGGPVSQSYKAVVLENGYISVTVLPELGGRVYSLKDKATGRELLYQNPVIKPTSWGYREWWLAAGGIEWAFPVADHGLNEWRPWTFSTAANSITVHDVDDRTGMEVGARLSLDADHSYLTIQPWATNRSSSSQPYQLWLNGMLAPGGNTVSGQTQFIVPAGQVIVHSTGDGALPGGGSALPWPVYDNRDLSIYGNWNGWLGFFAPTNGGFSGIYDHSNGQGLVRAHAPGWPGGLKIFGPSTLSPSLWTDGSSNYVEMWSGATSSFDSYATLEPGQRVDWTEYWYPINGTSGFDFANRIAALRLHSNGDGAEVALAVSTPIVGELVLYAGNVEVERWPLDMGPGQSFQASWTRSADQVGSIGLRLLGGDQIMAQTGHVP